MTKKRQKSKRPRVRIVPVRTTEKRRCEILAGQGRDLIVESLLEGRDKDQKENMELLNDIVWLTGWVHANVKPRKLLRSFDLFWLKKEWRKA